MTRSVEKLPPCHPAELDLEFGAWIRDLENELARVTATQDVDAAEELDAPMQELARVAILQHRDLAIDLIHLLPEDEGKSRVFDTLDRCSVQAPLQLDGISRHRAVVQGGFAAILTPLELVPRLLCIDRTEL